jgi:colicin import membrane protein
MASNKYYYQVLGVQSNASQDEIKQAFHQLAHKYHPDISTEPNAAQKFQDINEAYTALKNQKPVNKQRSKLPIIAIVGIISLVTILIFFNQYSLNAEEIQTGILNHNSEAISNLENANTNLAQQVISGTAVKVALIDFYLKNPPLWNKLDSYDHSIRADILKDDQVYHRLKDYYYRQIDNEIKEDKFKKALPLLGELKKAYPKKSELLNKYQQIQDKKQQRLADLTQKYMDCLYKTWVPLLERTHCMAAARDAIETVGIEHELPTDANLPAMYAKEVRLALKDQNYDHADEILLDWEKLLPAYSQQRDVLKDILYLRRERDNIIADLSGNDKMQIAKRLYQLNADPVLQEQVLEIAKVKNNLSKYKFNELLTIIASNYGDISPDNESKLREILEIPEEEDDEDDTTTQIASASTTIPPTIPIAIPIQANTQEEEKEQVVKNNTTKINNLLVECKQLYNKNYLTRGKRTALSCYRDILKIEPNNNQALDGINNIENKYYVWADNNLRKKKFGRVKYYIQALQKFNSNSSRLTGLKEKLKTAQQQAVAETNETTKANEAARLARLKASREKAVKEREAQLKATREAKLAARLKAAKEKEAAERKAARRAARKKAAEERATRLAARKKAAEERKAARLAARKKAAEERKAARLASKRKAAEERKAARRAARKKAAEEKRAARLAAKRKAAEERRAARLAAKRKAAEKRRAARLAAKRKAAEERRAARLAAKRKAAEERRAARLAAKRKAAEKRRAARLAAKRKAAEKRRAARLAAKRKAAEERKAARRAARKKAAEKRRAARLAAKRKAAEKRRTAKAKRRKRGGSCSRIIRQMSTGVKPLTPGQRAYFRKNCR